MHRSRLLIIYIGIFFSCLSSAQDKPDEFTGTPGLVYVEPTDVMVIQEDGEFRLVPYLERRKKWGSTVSFGYSAYEPVNYEPDFVTMPVDEVYSSPDSPMMELKVSVKRNTEFGSLGGELGVGIYSNQSDVDEDILTATLQIIPVYLGGVLSLDSLSKEPRFVPYFAAGLYSVFYEESADTRSVKGNTQVAPYVAGGINFQLDRLDKAAARIAFQDSGIQATYLYAQAVMLMESSAIKDKDFSNEMSWGVGIRVEF